MAAVAAFRIHKMQMPAGGVDAFHIARQTEANQVAGRILQIENRLVIHYFIKV